MRRALASSVVAVTVGTIAPSAHAAPVLAGTTCGLLSLHHDEATGQAHEGLLFGAVAAVDGSPLANPVGVSMTCSVTVNGTVVHVVPSVLDRGVAVVLGRATYGAGPTDTVKVCTDIDAPGSPGHSGCVDIEDQVIPPTEVCDQVDFLLDQVLPSLPPICTLTGQVTLQYVRPQVVIL